MASIHTRFHRKPSGSLRNIAMTCRGNPISEDELYKYTNGHFLINEQHQCQQRYVKFDISQLCGVAAVAGDSEAPIIAIEKMEGGFCKALLMKKSDGTEVVAKIPSKLAGPPKYSTTPEVATLKYVQQHATIPVPRELAWNCDSANDVGSEYIIMKAPGVQLYKKWGDMNGTAKLALIRHLVKLEAQLAFIHFPVSGSLYLRDSAGDTGECRPLCLNIDPSQSYCIGPSADRSWCIQSHMGTLKPEFSKGPWSSLSDYGVNLAKRERFRLSCEQRTNDRPYRRRSANEEIADLEASTRIIELLRHKKLTSLSKPILWHTDLLLGNIYVSEEELSHIVSIIDWQFISIGPLFMQATWPEFLKPSYEYVCGAVQPQLPDNFEQLDVAKKKYAASTRDDATITKSYELRHFLHNRDVYYSINLPSVFREIFVRCGEAGEEGTIGLRACLAELYQSWTELLRTEQEFQEYRDWHDVQEFARSYLDTDADGWISPEFDVAEIQQRDKTAFERYMKERSKRNCPHTTPE
ncbi:hypothetical protein AJ80_00319 [Polytolypa hystricis UAMH7299]|uniref:Altered inheritance of mitochondria protein 9, mitochondrial n=1 Tax=Polytolypa hystricis (strain UAMH7299) TaxID=1447883 RepID=A0A2B7Z499_POLH7|nr:hypothetical protein AJ80_00319 [Polytolypa hystricis UAMH7299]